MPNVFRSPRTIAEDKNRPENFDRIAGTGYDAEAGAPVGESQRHREPDYAANPINPPDPPVMARNLRK